MSYLEPEKAQSVREAILEPVLRMLRVRPVLPLVRAYAPCRLLDIGCGWNARLLKSLTPYLESGIGIDFKAPELKTPKIKCMSMTLDRTLDFAESSFDVVTMLAVLEHLERPGDILSEIHRVLRSGGALIGTVPSKTAKPVLEFLAYRLHIVSEIEIRDHKLYYDKADVIEALRRAGFARVEHRYFQFGMNNFFVAYKHDIL